MKNYGLSARRESGIKNGCKPGEQKAGVKKWLHVSIDREAACGMLSGCLMVVLSAAMTLFHSEAANILLRDVCMILLLGFLFPIYYILIVKKKSLAALGFHKNKLAVSLIINVAAGSSLLAMFMSQNTDEIRFTADSFYAVAYIFAAGIFEMVFIYGFLRCEFERAFGIVPAILLTAIFYSFHHAGFQPEFTKLFFVGMMYVTVFYLTQNIFSIFPFFWGTGAIWDVLVNSEAGNQIRNKTSFIIAVLMLAAMAGICIFIRHRIKTES